MSPPSVQTHGDGRFSVEGELSFASAPALWEQSREAFTAAGDNVEIDLQAVARADSAGLALLVAWTRWARSESKSIRFTHVPKQILTLAEGNNLNELLNLRPA